jgi:hypothetical protein
MVEISFEQRGYGHDYTFTPVDGGKRGKMVGWCAGIKPGTFLILPNGDKTTRYQVETIKYKTNPPDMFVAQVVWAPRQMVATTGA